MLCLTQSAQHPYRLEKSRQEPHNGYRTATQAGAAGSEPPAATTNTKHLVLHTVGQQNLPVKHQTHQVR